MNYNKIHRKLVGYNCSIFWVEFKMRLPCVVGTEGFDQVLPLIFGYLPPN
jgi:hypothetical protein